MKRSGPKVVVKSSCERCQRCPILRPQAKGQNWVWWSTANCICDVNTPFHSLKSPSKLEIFSQDVRRKTLLDVPPQSARSRSCTGGSSRTSLRRRKGPCFAPHTRKSIPLLPAIFPTCFKPPYKSPRSKPHLAHSPPSRHKAEVERVRNEKLGLEGEIEEAINTPFCPCFKGSQRYF